MNVTSLQHDCDSGQLAIGLLNATARDYSLIECRYETEGLHACPTIIPAFAVKPQSRRVLRVKIPNFHDMAFRIFGKRMDLQRHALRCVYMLSFSCTPMADWKIRPPAKKGRSSESLSNSRKYAEIISEYARVQTELWPMTFRDETQWKHFVVVHPEPTTLRIGPFLRCSQGKKQAFEYRREDKQAEWRDIT